MIIDVLKLKQEGKQTAVFNFCYQADNSLLSLPNATFLGPVLVGCEISLEGRDVFADINIKYTVKGECSRCLEPAEKVHESSVSVKFSLMPEEDEYLYKSGKVDLTSPVNEEIIVNQPTVIYCKDDCKGLCPICGANLNASDCGHGHNEK